MTIPSLNKTATPPSTRMQIDDSRSDAPILIMRRIFEAKRELVWDVLTSPEHVKEWYGGDGFHNPVCEMDVRPQGRWHHVMRTPDGREVEMNFVFLEVIRPEKLVWQNAGGHDERGPHNNIMTVTLEEDGPYTLWTLVTRFRSFEDRTAAASIGFAHVLSQGADKLNRLAKRLST